MRRSPKIIDGIDSATKRVLNLFYDWLNVLVSEQINQWNAGKIKETKRFFRACKHKRGREKDRVRKIELMNYLNRLL